MGRIERVERIRQVELKLREHGWNGQWIEDFAAEIGVSAPTIRRDREVVIAYIKAENLGSREDRRAKFLIELESDITATKADGKWSALVGFRNLQHKILGLDIAPPELPDPDAEEAEVEPTLKGTLIEVRKLRLDAVSRGSLVAAEKLLGRELEIVAEMETERKRLEELKASVATDDAILQQFTSAINDLPDAVVDRLIVALEKRKTT